MKVRKKMNEKRNITKKMIFFFDNKILMLFL